MPTRKKNKIGYIGYSLDAIESIFFSEYFKLEIIFVPKSRVTCLIRLFAESREIKLYTINDAEDLHQKLSQHINDISCCLMYDCGIIVKKKTIDILDIFNIHPGNLRYNRGNNPFEHSFLDNERHMTISLHKINERIDMGQLIHTWKIPIYIRDSLRTLEYKVYGMIPNILLKLKDFLDGEIFDTALISEGIYKPKLTTGYIKIDINNDKPITIFNKIKASGYICNSEMTYISEIKPISEQFKPWYNQGALIDLPEGTYCIVNIIRLEYLDNDATAYSSLLDEETMIIQKEHYKFTVNYVCKAKHDLK